MFMVTEAERLAIRRAFEAGGEAEALAEMQRIFPIQGEGALSAVRSILRWGSAETREPGPAHPASSA